MNDISVDVIDLFVVYTWLQSGIALRGKCPECEYPSTGKVMQHSTTCQLGSALRNMGDKITLTTNSKRAMI